MLANDVLHTIGNTPHIRINRLFGRGHDVYIKSERSNPGGSIKDRIALARARDAVRHWSSSTSASRTRAASRSSSDCARRATSRLSS